MEMTFAMFDWKRGQENNKLLVGMLLHFEISPFQNRVYFL